VYADASALVKLVVAEVESERLVHEVRRWRMLTSIVSAVEVRRIVRRHPNPRPFLAQLAQVLDGASVLDLDRDIAHMAGDLQPPALRSLDAIQLATALSVGTSLDALVTYDRRLGAAAAVTGLRVLAPGAVSA